MTQSMLRSILGPVAGAAICLIAMPHIGAVGSTPIIEQFVGKAVSIVDADQSAGRVDIYIERWSTDADAEQLRAWAGPEGGIGNLLPGLQQQHRSAGVVLLPGVQGHGARARLRTPKNLLFARQVITPAGRHVVAISDERLAIGESAMDARKEVAEFNLIDIRFGPDGSGVGKVASEASVGFSTETKTIEIKDFAGQPTRLVDVKSLKGDIKSVKG